MSCRLLAPAVGVHTYVYVYIGTVRPKSKQGNTTNMNNYFSIENDKRAAQVIFKHISYKNYTSYEADALPTECNGETGKALREARPLVFEGAGSWDRLQLLVWIHAYTCTYWGLESTFTLQGTLMQ